MLEDWIDERAKSGAAFGVVGDFNRRFDREGKVARDAQLARSSRCGPRSTTASLPVRTSSIRASTTARSAAETVSASACRSTTLFWANGWPGGWCQDSFRVWDYPAGGRWPDHCVISIELER